MKQPPPKKAKQLRFITLVLTHASQDARLMRTKQTIFLWSSILKLTRPVPIPNAYVFSYGALMNTDTCTERKMRVQMKKRGTVHGYELVVSNGFFGAIPNTERSINGFLLKLDPFVPEAIYEIRKVNVTLINGTRMEAYMHRENNF